MEKSLCKISIIIRSYNSRAFIENAVQSALVQSLNRKFYEIIIIDDGSSDGTANILKKYGKILKIKKQNHAGPTKALNEGIKISSGDYIIILDSDDIFRKDALEKLFFAIKGKKDIKFSYCDYKEILLNKKSKVVSLKNNIFKSVAGGIMYKKEILEEFNGYDEDLIFPEYDLLIKVFQKYKGIHVPKPLYIYRRRKDGITKDRDVVELGRKQISLKYNKNFKIRSY